MKQLDKNNRLHTIINLGFALALILIIIIGIISYSSTKNLVNNASLVSHTKQVIKELNYISSVINNADNDEGDYLMTGKKNFMEDFTNIQQIIPSEIDKLKVLTSDNPNQQVRIEKISSLTENFLLNLKKIIELNDQQGFNITQKFLISPGNKEFELKKEIFKILLEMEEEENTLLTERQSQTRKSANNTIYIIIFGSLIAVILGLISLLMINRYISQLTSIQKKLEENEANLEIKVKERTSELLIVNKEIEALANELKKSNQELTSFASIASHDLQEPLRTIANYAQLLQRRAKDKLNESEIDFLNFMIDATTRMRKLIDSLLIYSKVGAKEKELKDIDLNKIIENVNNNLQTSIENNKAKIYYNDLPVIKADEMQMIQLFQNIISNSIKYRSEKEPVINISSKLLDNKWLFALKDNGIGIEKDYLDKVFDVFRRLHTRDEYEGTGIGLSTCKKIVELYGGKIWVESEKDEGSVFYFTLPVAQTLQKVLN